MRRSLALAVVVVALAAPAVAAAEEPDAVDCFRTYVTRADPVPRTPEEHVDAVVRDVNRTVTFATCVV